MATTSIYEPESLEWAPSRWRPITTFVLSLVAFCISGYLTYLHYWGNSAPALCSRNGPINCTKVLTSSQSMIFGVIPVAVVGLCFYAFVVVLNSPPMWRSKWHLMPLARTMTMTAAVVMVLYLIAAELIWIKAICEYCTAVHVLTLAIFFIVITGWNDMQAHYAAAIAHDAA